MNASANRIVYLGDDAAYFRVLSAEIQRIQGGTPVKLEQVFETTTKRIQGLLPRVLDMRPTIIFVDFSKQTDDYVHLARLLVRTNTTVPFTLIGLHDYLSPELQVKESFLTGVGMNFIKSAEVFDPAFAALVMLNPNTKREHGFATAQLEEEVVAHHLCKIGYVDPQTLHFETNMDFANGSELRIKNYWHDEKILHSNLVKVRQSNSSLLFYHFNHSVNADFAWVDPLVKSETDSPERTKELEGEHEHALIKTRKSFKTWLDNNLDRSQNKSVRVLVVDRSHSFYQDRERSDTYGYAIRCQPFLLDAAKELEAQQPHVIAFALDDAPSLDKKEATGPANDMAALKAIISYCSDKFKEHPPYVVVFNIKETNSRTLQQLLGYPNAMAYDSEIGPEVLLKMAGIFAGKIQLVKDKNKDPKAKEVPMVFIKKSSAMSIGEIEQVVKLERLSETDAVIHCDRPLANGTVLHFKSPFVGYLTITPHSQYSKAPSYYALLNGVGELGKKELRVYVNAIFFKDHDATKQVELDAFQQINDLKWQEQLKKEEARLAAEAAAAAEKAAKDEAEAKAKASAEVEVEAEELKKVSNG